jgi:hypothetical protein
MSRGREVLFIGMGVVVPRIGLDTYPGGQRRRCDTGYILPKNGVSIKAKAVLSNVSAPMWGFVFET